MLTLLRKKNSVTVFKIIVGINKIAGRLIENVAVNTKSFIQKSISIIRLFTPFRLINVNVVVILYVHVLCS